LVRSRRYKALREIVKRIRGGPVSRSDFTEMPDATYYDNVNRAIYLGIAKELPDHRIAWIDFVSSEDLINHIQSFELLNCRHPDLEELAQRAGKPPQELEKDAYDLASRGLWLPPTDKQKAESHYRASFRLQLAAWTKLGCGESEFVKHNWPEEEEVKKAEIILKQHPEYVPSLEFHKVLGDTRNQGNHKVYFTLFYPKLVEEIAGISGLTADQMVSEKELRGCIEHLKVVERPY
jgi:hypothetical protein